MLKWTTKSTKCSKLKEKTYPKGPTMWEFLVLYSFYLNWRTISRTTIMEKTGSLSQNSFAFLRYFNTFMYEYIYIYIYIYNPIPAQLEINTEQLQSHKINHEFLQ